MYEPEIDEAVERRRDDHWHVGKEIPIALILVVLIQTGGGIWWASAMNAKIDTALATLSEFKAERYTRDDARRDREFMFAQIEALKSRDIEIDRRIAAVERAHENLQMSGIRLK